MVTNSTEFSEAIVFIQNNRVAREMLYSEFEAILDGYVPIDITNQEVQAVYLRVNFQLCVTSAVFFKIKFDQEGFADRRWNIPLEQLAENSAKGPDLGAGSIRLACRSQCCIAWHQQNLWDPDMNPGSNNFVLIKKYIKSNRLSLPVREPAPALREQAAAPSAAATKKQAREIEQRVSQKLKQEFEQQFRNRMAQLLKEQRLRILTLNTKKQQEVQQLQMEHQGRLQEYRDAINQYQSELEAQMERNKNLKEKIDGQARKIEGVREYYEHKLKSVELDEGEQLMALKSSFDTELQAKLEAATMDLKDALQVKEVELLYRSEQEASLEEEVKRLREERQVLLQNTSEQLLEKLEGAGLNFVAYHPGAGHLTIPLADMANYLEDPRAYAAKKCGVTVAQYMDWLEHHKSPSCRALKSGGSVCGDVIERVPTPSQFHRGENDRCDHHRAVFPTSNIAAL